MEIKKAIRTRRAVRRFTEDPIPDDVIQDILETARWSQSSKNTQPWEFVVITDRTLLEELSKAGDFATHLPHAAFGVALVGANDSYIVGFDLGQAAMCLQLAAYEQGIGSCLISFHRPEQAGEILGVPEDRFVRIGLSFGYPSAQNKPAKLGGRNRLDDMIHWNGW